MYKKLFLLFIFLTFNSFALTVEELDSLIAEGRFQEAKEKFEASDLSRKNKNVIERLIKIYANTGPRKDYYNYLAYYIKLGGNVKYQDVWAAAMGSFEIKDYNNTITFCKYSNYLSPNNHSVFNLMGVAYYYIQNYELSVIALRSAVKLMPDEAIYIANLARSYEDMKDYKNAYKYYKISLQKDPNFIRSRAALERLKNMGIN